MQAAPVNAANLLVATSRALAFWAGTPALPWSRYSARSVCDTIAIVPTQ
jgi:hypothetical protein